jgi:hypothetical protein
MDLLQKYLILLTLEDGLAEISLPSEFLPVFWISDIYKIDVLYIIIYGITEVSTSPM